MAGQRAHAGCVRRRVDVEAQEDREERRRRRAAGGPAPGRAAHGGGARAGRAGRRATRPRGTAAAGRVGGVRRRHSPDRQADRPA
eukprot:8646505-Alexandrium_andersonii.AAC.1